MAPDPDDPIDLSDPIDGSDAPAATVDLPRTRAVMEDEVEEGLFTRGAQVAVQVAGVEVFSSATGEAGNGTPMAVDSVLRVYCAIKPVTALAIARQVDDGALDLDEPLSV